MAGGTDVQMTEIIKGDGVKNPVWAAAQEQGADMEMEAAGGLAMKWVGGAIKTLQRLGLIDFATSLFQAILPMLAARIVEQIDDKWLGGGPKSVPGAKKLGAPIDPMPSK